MSVLLCTSRFLHIHFRSTLHRACVIEYGYYCKSASLHSFDGDLPRSQHIPITLTVLMCTYIDLAFSKSASLSSLSLPVLATPPVTFAMMISFA